MSPSMMPRLPTLITTVAAAVLATAIVLLAVLPTAEPPQSLHGVWQAVLVEPGAPPRPIEVPLPSSFRAQGIEPHSVLHAAREVDVPASQVPYTLHLSSVRHALEVRWDGAVVASVGQPHQASSTARHEGAVLAFLPADPEGGRHRLELTVRGDLYRGGLAGQIRLARTPAMNRALLREAGVRLGFALAFALVGLLHVLGSATTRDTRVLELLFGCFTLSLAAYAFEHAATGLLWTGHPLQHHHLRRLFVSGIFGFALAFIQRFVHGRLDTPTRAALAVCAGLPVLALVGPWWSVLVETLQDALGFLVLVPWLFATQYRGWRRRMPGAGWLAAAMLIASAGGIAEVLVTHGLVAGPRWLYPALTLFLLFGSLAVAQQDRALSDRHRRLVTGSEDAMIEVDTEGRVHQLNPAARAFLPGLDDGRIIAELVPEASQPLVSAHLARAGSAPTRCEFALLDGRVVESVATPLDADTRLLVLRDVSRRRRAEDDLLTAARVETAGQLLGGVAHDFNNLLSALLGHVGLLRLTHDSDATAQRLDRMEEAIERASGITRRLLAVGGRSHTTIDDVALHDLLEEVREMAEPALPQGIVLRIEPEDAVVRASAEDLRHVLLNLVLNARDAVEGGGTITLRCEVRADEVRIEVHDTGPGVPKRLRDRIWDPFFTTKGPDRGTGLGLPMARRLVRQQGGRIDYVDGCFRIGLPIGTPDRAPITHHGGARVAVVDDEEAVRQAFAEALRQAGYVATTHEDATRALPALVAEPPDLLVTDVVMPGMNGLELAEALRELQPGLPVVVVSGFVPSSGKLLQDGLSEQLDKPVRPARVVDAVSRLLSEAQRVA